ncbi:hypothetical protein ACPOLB_16975 [Rubrivivax sp. RP6-9]|uniref:hypothetical protein n=1 Tax=Rubrivivax sp. RP6-9 TaxID=3415750 RepID=UPI003CC59A99
MTTARERPPNRLPALLVGVTFGLFAVGALATALMLEGPGAALPLDDSESAYVLATAPALRPAQAMLPVADCAPCGVVESVVSLQGGSARYQLVVRLPDGSLRSIASSSAVGIGQRISLDGVPPAHAASL